MTSAIFQSDGKVEVPSEQLIISVIGPSITCRASLNTLALVLSGPGALFNGKDKMTRLTSSMLTRVKLKQSSEDDTRSGIDEFALSGQSSLIPAFTISDQLLTKLSHHKREYLPTPVHLELIFLQVGIWDTRRSSSGSSRDSTPKVLADTLLRLLR